MKKNINKKVAVSPDKPQEIPWQADCQLCDFLKSQPKEMELPIWIETVADHMHSHNISLHEKVDPNA